MCTPVLAAVQYFYNRLAQGESGGQRCGFKGLIIIISIALIIRTKLIMLSSWGHCRSLSVSSDECRTAPSGCWPLDQVCLFGPWACSWTAIVHVCYYYFPLLNQEADTRFKYSFSRTTRAEGFSRPIWLVEVWSPNQC